MRAANIRAELYLGNPKSMGNQLKYADKRGSPCVVLQGSDEKERGEVQIKDLILGAEIAGLSKEREDYLKKQAEAQFAVKEEDLVDGRAQAAHAPRHRLKPTLLTSAPAVSLASSASRARSSSCRCPS